MRDAIHRKCVEPDLLGHAGPPAPCTERSSNDRCAPQLGEVLAYNRPLARAKDRKALVLARPKSAAPALGKPISREQERNPKSDLKNRPSPRHFRCPV